MSDESNPQNLPPQAARVVELEARIMFLQQSLDDLNGVVLEQQAELTRLRRELEALRALTRRLIDHEDQGDLPDEKPPHY